MKNIRIALVLLATSLPACLTARAAAPEKNNFSLTDKDGKLVGTAAYTVSKQKNGYRVESHFEYKITPEMTEGSGQNNTSSKRGGSVSTAPSMSFTLQLNDDIELDGKGTFVSGYLANKQQLMMRSYSPSKDRKTIDVREMKGQNVTDQKTLNMQTPDYVLAPAYDPGALQAFLLQVKLNPHADNTYTLLVPPAQFGGLNLTEPVVVQALDDVKGTRSGQDMAVKAYLLNFHDGHAEIFTDADGNLMEADMANLHVHYMRDGFKLAVESNGSSL